MILESFDFEVVRVPLKSDNYMAVLGMDILDAFTLKFHRKTGFVELPPTLADAFVGFSSAAVDGESGRDIRGVGNCSQTDI